MNADWKRLTLGYSKLNYRNRCSHFDLFINTSIMSPAYFHLTANAIMFSGYISREDTRAVISGLLAPSAITVTLCMTLSNDRINWKSQQPAYINFRKYSSHR